MKSILTVSGKDLSHFMEQWLCRCGIPSFTISFSYVRKKNLIELKMKQDLPRNLAKFNVSDICSVEFSLNVSCVEKWLHVRCALQ